MERADVYSLIEKHYRDNFKNLTIRYSRQLQSLARAEDVVQEAYTRALRYWERYSLEQDFGAWLNTILINCLRDNMREERMQGAVEYPPEEEQTIRPAAIPSIILEQVEARINSKSPDVAAVLRHALLEQGHQKEVAEATGRTPKAVEMIVRRFRKEIKDDFDVAI